MNRKGVSIIEALAAIVILGLITSLTAVLLRTISIANQAISEEAKANIEATKLISYLNNFYEEYNPTDYLECSTSNCVILIKSFEYSYNSETSLVELITYDPILETVIEFTNNTLIIDNTNYNLEYFSFDDGFLITTTINDKNKITIKIDFTLVSENTTFSFSTSHTFDKQIIPEA